MLLVLKLLLKQKRQLHMQLKTKNLKFTIKAANVKVGGIDFPWWLDSDGLVFRYEEEIRLILSNINGGCFIESILRFCIPTIGSI